jgi:hypothetical protein
MSRLSKVHKRRLRALCIAPYYYVQLRKLKWIIGVRLDEVSTLKFVPQRHSFVFQNSLPFRISDRYIVCISHFLHECYPARVHSSLYAMPRMIFREWPERGRIKGETKGFFRPLIVTANAKLSVRLINHFTMNLYRCGMTETWSRRAVEPNVSFALFPGKELPVSTGDRPGFPRSRCGFWWW